MVPLYISHHRSYDPRFIQLVRKMGEDGRQGLGLEEIVVSAASAIEVATGTGHPTETGLEPTQLEQQYAEHREHQSEEEADEATEFSFAIQEDRIARLRMTMMTTGMAAGLPRPTMTTMMVGTNNSQPVLRL
jgi:hypothetical protein